MDETLSLLIKGAWRPYTLYPNGWAIGTINYDNDTVTFTWQGGEIAAISYDLLKEADPRHIRREGNRITVGQFTLWVIEDNYSHNFVTCILDSPRAWFLSLIFKALRFVAFRNNWLLFHAEKLGILDSKPGEYLAWKFKLPSIGH